MKNIIKKLREKPVRTACKIIILLIIVIDVFRAFGFSCGKRRNQGDINYPAYMIYYGELNDKVIAEAKQYDIVILHLSLGNVTGEQVREIQAGGAKVFGYLSVGEDLRTNGMTSEQMLEDERFTGDGTGPRVDPREEGIKDLDNIDLSGDSSPAGNGFASYYLDDNDRDGLPDFNPNFNCAYTNIGDPAWYDVLDNMSLDENDRVAGIKEILTEDYGRGFGCDGVFLDTIDTCAPNSYTNDEDPDRTRFEWTAPGVRNFMAKLKENYPDKYIIQNRGLFFYHYMIPHFEYSPGEYIDYLMFESYMLDSNPSALYYEGYFADNKYIYAPKISAEANRPDGFKVLSLGYAEGPEEYQLKNTLAGDSDAGNEILTEDIFQAEDEAGFSHYITDGGLTLANDFVLEHRNKVDLSPPVWSSVHNASATYPKEEPTPRVGIGEVEPIENGVIVRWDVAVDKNGVVYTLYYQKTPFDFAADPDLEKAQKIELVPEVGDGYTCMAGAETYPYQSVIKNLDGGEVYYFVIRAKDCSGNSNEEKNTVVVEESPLQQ